MILRMIYISLEENLKPYDTKHQDFKEFCIKLCHRIKSELHAHALKLSEPSGDNNLSFVLHGVDV